MAKNYAQISNNIADYIVVLNGLVNKVGDLSNLNSSEDSDIVGAINAVLQEGSVDSAAILAMLDSGNYLSFDDLEASTDSDFVLTKNAQTIGGRKTFSDSMEVQGNLHVVDSNANLFLRSTTRRDSSEVFRFTHTDSGLELRLEDSVGDFSQKVIVFSTSETPDSNVIDVIKLYTNGSLAGRIDSGGYSTTSTFMTRDKADARYINDQSNIITTDKINNSAVTTDKINNSAVTANKIANSAVTTDKINNSAVTTNKINNDAVTQAKLASVVTLQIIDSSGSTVKTLYGAGS
jgi:hypothetical protein